MTEQKKVDQKCLKYFLVSNSDKGSAKSTRNIFLPKFGKLPFSTSSDLTSEMLNVVIVP